MALSKEVRRLANSWTTDQFPKHLEYVEITNVRGWQGERVEFKFRIVAIVGENGLGKSTVLQAAAAVYKPPGGEQGYFASYFFPDTAWDNLRQVEIRASVKEGTTSRLVFIRKPTTRWRGNETRRERVVRFLDLKRILPIYSKAGYARLAKGNLTEASAELFTNELLTRLSGIIGRSYSAAKQATTNLDAKRKVPVLSVGALGYSGFHQGAGETTIAELLSSDIPGYALVVIDEIETSLHPRAQRRLIRDLAEISRLKKVQFIVTTHSPSVLEELPALARIQIVNDLGMKKTIQGVSAEFALSRMDEEMHPELDIYVEDIEAKIMLEEILALADLQLLSRLQMIPYGAANVGKALGQMNHDNRFPTPSLVFLDADQDPSDGCLLLPGDDAPERVVFHSLNQLGWPGVAANINRSHADLVNYCQNAMTLPDHHGWVKAVADNLIIGGNELWRALCRSWVATVYKPAANNPIVTAIHDRLIN